LYSTAKRCEPARKMTSGPDFVWPDEARDIRRPPASARRSEKRWTICCSA
jgi:hypothetical protein